MLDGILFYHMAQTFVVKAFNLNVMPHFAIYTSVSSDLTTGAKGSVMAEPNLLKIIGSVGTGIFCSVQ